MQQNPVASGGNPAAGYTGNQPTNQMMAGNVQSRIIAKNQHPQMSNSQMAGNMYNPNMSNPQPHPMQQAGYPVPQNSMQQMGNQQAGNQPQQQNAPIMNQQQFIQR